MRQGKRKDPAAEPARQDLKKENDALTGALADIMAESWRFRLAMEKTLRRMDPMDAERFSRQYSYFASRVRQAMADAGLSCIDLTGQYYDVGMAVQPMNLEEFGEDEQLLVDRMIEPVIMGKGRLLRTGAVMLARAEQED